MIRGKEPLDKLFEWLKSGENILKNRYNYPTVGPSSRNLPFLNHDLAQLVLLLRQATESLDSVLPDNELVLLSLPSQNQSPSGPQISLSQKISWRCEKGVRIRKKN